MAGYRIYLVHKTQDKRKKLRRTLYTEGGAQRYGENALRHYGLSRRWWRVEIVKAHQD